MQSKERPIPQVHIDPEKKTVVFGAAIVHEPSEKVHIIEPDLPTLKQYIDTVAANDHVILSDGSNLQDLAWQLEACEYAVVVANSDYTALADEFATAIAHIPLLLSQYKDMGKKAFHNATSHGPLYSGESLKECQKGKTALVVGAGPSLDLFTSDLQTLPKEALVIACGSAAQLLSQQDIPVALTVALDPDVPKKRYTNLPDAPIVLQFQTDSFLSQKGAYVLGTNGCFPFLDSLYTEACGTCAFEAGWNAGTYGVALASYMGCEKILVCGIDITEDGYAQGICDDHKRSDEELKRVRLFLDQFPYQPLTDVDAVSRALPLPQQKKPLPKLSYEKEWECCMQASISPSVLTRFEREETTLFQNHLIPLYECWKYRLDFPDKELFYYHVLQEIAP